MRISKLSVHNFRNINQKTIEFGDLTVFVGENGAGKTSLVEALALIATGVSFRAANLEEMILVGEPLARVLVTLHDESDRVDNLHSPEKEAQDATNLEIILTRGEIQGKKTPRRIYIVNEIHRQKRVFLGNVQISVFRPEDLRLIEGSPSRRRGFLDSVLVQFGHEYVQSLEKYEGMLVRRNKLLQQVREREQPKTVLSFWNQGLVKHGELVQKHRAAFVDFMQAIPFPIPLRVRYEPSIISESRQIEYLDREIASGHTLIGPHKDDISVGFEPTFFTKLHQSEKPLSEDWFSLSAYGSRGQQRMGVLWLKLGELAFIEKQANSRPLLLLDDIFSELDSSSRDLVRGLVGKYQTIVTTAVPALASSFEAQGRTAVVVNLSAK